jgi:uncharacterized protein (DUF305 family)
MKSIFKTFKSLQMFSFLVGIVFGAATGLVLFCYLVPGGTKTIGLYHSKIAQAQEAKNKDEMMHIYEGDIDGHQTYGTNPYAVNKITSEAQFLQEMILLHNAAIAISNQVLVIPSVHKEVRDLAKIIITSQTSQVTAMKEWDLMWRK